MEKTADLIIFQRTVIDVFLKESKRLRSIAKEAHYLQSSVSKANKLRLGRKKCDRTFFLNNSNNNNYYHIFHKLSICFELEYI